MRLSIYYETIDSIRFMGIYSFDDPIYRVFIVFYAYIKNPLFVYYWWAVPLLAIFYAEASAPTPWSVDGPCLGCARGLRVGSVWDP